MYLAAIIKNMSTSDCAVASLNKKFEKVLILDKDS